MSLQQCRLSLVAASRAWRHGLRTFIALEQPITQELIGSHPIIQVSTLPTCIQLYRKQSDACEAHQSSLDTWQQQPLSLAACSSWHDVHPTPALFLPPPAGGHGLPQ